MNSTTTTPAVVALPERGPLLTRPGWSAFIVALLLVCARQARKRAPQTARWLKLASALFLVSITCRAIDQAICPVWPIGTHLGWHLVNAAMLYSCMRGLLADSAAPSAPAKHTVKSMI